MKERKAFGNSPKMPTISFRSVITNWIALLMMPSLSVPAPSFAIISGSDENLAARLVRMDVIVKLVPVKETTCSAAAVKLPD